MTLNKYINWNDYWTDEVICQIPNLEDYEPEVKDTTIEEVKKFVEYRNTQLINDECYINGDDVCLCLADGDDEEAVILWVFVGNDDLIKNVSIER